MRLPVAPLAERFEAQGGLHALLISLGVQESSPDYDRFTTAMRRARKTGVLTVGAADGLSVHVLGLHPVEVFGDAWWAAWAR